VKKVALIGANGMLATAIKKLRPPEYSLQLYDLPDFDMTDRMQVMSLQDSAPEIILNCAAFTNVDGCETEQQLAMEVNGEAVGFLAELAKATNAVLVHISTDFVFDGAKSSPYLEDDRPNPLSVYGKSKLLGEMKIGQAGLERCFIIRTSWLYGAGGGNFVETMIRLAKERSELKVVDDQRGTPTWTDDLAKAIFALLETDAYGTYHFSNMGSCSWYEFAQEVIEQVRKFEPLKIEALKPILTEGYPLPATRPKYSVMSKAKILAVTALQIPAWKQSLSDCILSRYRD